MQTNYIISTSIGRGSFGSVYYCVHKETGKESALKILSKPSLHRQTIVTQDEDVPLKTQLDMVYDEISFMQKHKHPTLLQIIEVIDNENEDKIYLVLQLAEGILCQVYDDISRTPLTSIDIQKLPLSYQNLCSLVTQPIQSALLFQQMHQVAIALDILHSKGIAHGDLKHANILRLAQERYVLADFGLTQSEETGKAYKGIVSPAYSAPEGGLTCAGDVYSFGVVFFMCALGFHPAVLSALLQSKKMMDIKEAHYGSVIVKHFKDCRDIFTNLIKLRSQSQNDSLSRLMTLHQIKSDTEGLQTLSEVLGQIIIHCFAPIEKRPTIKQILTKLNELYSKFHASKIQKHFQKNTNIEATLLQICQNYNKTGKQLDFLIQIHYFKTLKENYIQLLDVETFQPSKIFDQDSLSVSSEISEKEHRDTIDSQVSNLSKLDNLTKTRLQEFRASDQQLLDKTTPQTIKQNPSRPASSNFRGLNLSGPVQILPHISNHNDTKLSDAQLLEKPLEKPLTIINNLKPSAKPSMAAMIAAKLSMKDSINVNSMVESSLDLKDPAIRLISDSGESKKENDVKSISDDDKFLQPIDAKQDQFTSSQQNLIKAQDSPLTMQSQRFPGIKIPISAATKLAAKLKTQEEDHSLEDSLGPINIRATKPMKAVIEPKKVPQDAPKQKPQNLTPRNLNIAQTNLVQDDDLFDSIEELTIFPTNQHRMPRPSVVQKQVMLMQRQNYFVKLDLHYSNIKDAPKKKEIDQLFKQILYVHDSKTFNYNYNQDQNQLIGLGSFSKEMNMDEEQRHDEMSDLSDSSDLVVIGENSNPEEVIKQVYQILDPDNEDEEDIVWTGGLIQRGKSFQKLGELKDEDNEISSIVEEDEDDFLLNKKPPIKLQGMEFTYSMNLKDNSSSSSSSGEEFITSNQQLRTPSAAAYPNTPKLTLQLGVQVIPEKNLFEKVRLFDEDSEEELETVDQRVTARIQNKVTARKQQQNMPMLSAREATRRENPEGAELSFQQSVLFFRPLIKMYYQIVQVLESKTQNDQEYRQIRTEFESPLKAIAANMPVLQAFSLDDLFYRFTIWKDHIQRKMVVSQNILKILNDQFQTYEQIIDSQPSFLRHQCGWVLMNQYNIYKSLDMWQTLYSMQHSTGLKISINNQSLFFSKKQDFHDIQIYIGLEKAESTPIVGVRHKSNTRTLIVQMSDRNLIFQEQDDILKQTFANKTVMQTKETSLLLPQKKFFQFRFSNQYYCEDFEQNQVQKMLYQMIFFSINKQVIMPILMLDCLYDMIENSCRASKPSTVRAAVFNSENNLYIIVCDAGNGLLEEVTERVFTLREERPGCGTGLSRLRMIVGFYNGVVNVSSIQGGGTKIVVKIPLVAEGAKSPRIQQ